MMEYKRPKIIINDDGVIMETIHQSQTGTVDMSANHYVDYQWPWYYWPCCGGSGSEQMMELEMNGQKIIIKGKDLKIKVEEVK